LGFERGRFALCRRCMRSDTLWRVMNRPEIKGDGQKLAHLLFRIETVRRELGLKPRYKRAVAASRRRRRPRTNNPPPPGPDAMPPSDLPPPPRGHPTLTVRSRSSRRVSISVVVFFAALPVFGLLRRSHDYHVPAGELATS
jgi:hypothetical protein